ncbi:hypothetical protein OJ998_19835 [Solirubrobacter taibaiensis]|nr:hypothetical protein [Solirubrobacter taibaiensis]
MIARPLAVREDGADDLSATAPEVVISPAAWQRFNEGAVWCALDDLADGSRLRVAIAGLHGVLEHGDVRGLLPAPAAPGWFWTASGLWSTAPGSPAVDATRWLRPVDAWLQRLEPTERDLPPALRLRLGEGEDEVRHEILLRHEGGWLRGRRYVVDDEPVVVIDDFSMKQLLLDLSLLLALTVVRH